MRRLKNLIDVSDGIRSGAIFEELLVKSFSLTGFAMQGNRDCIIQRITDLSLGWILYQNFLTKVRLDAVLRNIQPVCTNTSGSSEIGIL